MQRPVKIEYTKVAEKDILKLPKLVAHRILKKIEANVIQADVLSRAKPLTGQFAGAYRYRVGEYRVVFVLNEQGVMIVLTVLQVKHRKDVYK